MKKQRLAEGERGGGGNDNNNSSSSSNKSSSSAALASLASPTDMLAPSPATMAKLLSLEVLPFTTDIFGGVAIELNEHDERILSKFDGMMDASMAFFRAERKRGVWVKINIHHYHGVIGTLLKHSFEMHHSQSPFLTFTYWIPHAIEKNPLPPFASHYVGVGVVVYDKESNNILVVSEKYGPTVGLFKYITGLVDVGEYVRDAAIRECKEESGLDVKFECVLSCKENQRWQFGRSDIFFMCLCTPVDSKQPLKPQAEEIVAVKWISLHDFENLPLYRDRQASASVRVCVCVCVCFPQTPSLSFSLRLLVDDGECRVCG
jgi:ADP-ribose pyrophosphatase YjhB (NUDIX family)